MFHHCARARVATHRAARWQKIACKRARPVARRDNRVLNQSYVLLKPRLFRPRELSHPPRHPRGTEESLCPGSDSKAPRLIVLHSPTSFDPSNPVRVSYSDFCFYLPDHPSSIMSSTVSHVRASPHSPSVLNVEFFLLASKACNGQPSCDESTAGHQQRS